MVHGCVSGNLNMMPMVHPRRKIIFKICEDNVEWTINVSLARHICLACRCDLLLVYSKTFSEDFC